MRQSPYSFCLTILPPPTSTLFPYTTLFRSITRNAVFGQHRQGGLHAAHEGRGFLTAGEVDVSWHRRVIERIHADRDRKSTRLNSSHVAISYAVFCLKKKKTVISCACE